jgi:hypothetical protein
MHRVQLCSIKANSVAACFIAALLNLRPLRLKLYIKTWGTCRIRPRNGGGLACAGRQCCWWRKMAGAVACCGVHLPESTRSA